MDPEDEPETFDIAQDEHSALPGHTCNRQEAHPDVWGSMQKDRDEDWADSEDDDTWADHVGDNVLPPDTFYSEESKHKESAAKTVKMDDSPIPSGDALLQPPTTTTVPNTGGGASSSNEPAQATNDSTNDFLA